MKNSIKIKCLRLELLFISLILILFSSDLKAAWITDVQIIPDIPDFSDEITISVSGGIGYSEFSIDNVEFSMVGNVLKLDIFFTHGIHPGIGQWIHDEAIGCLMFGNYELTVETYDPPDINDSCYMEFDVIPEPAICTLFTVGLFASLLRGHKSKR